MKKPVWISHRGARSKFTENTKEAFDRAIKEGYQFLETDLRLTKDGYLVLCHDPDLFRLGGPKTPLLEMTREEIQKIRLLDGTAVLFFEEFIEHYAGLNWIFDIKPEGGEKTIACLMEWMTEKCAKKWISEGAWFLMNDKKQQKNFENLFPEGTFLATEIECILVGVAFLLGLRFLVPVVPNKIYGVPESFFGFFLFTKKFINHYHSKQAKVIAYLPSTKELSQKSLDAGCDFVLMDS